MFPNKWWQMMRFWLIQYTILGWTMGKFRAQGVHQTGQQSLFKGTIKMMTTTCSCLWWTGWHWLWPEWDRCPRSAWGSWDVLFYWPHLSPAWRSTFLQKSAFLFSDSSRLLCIRYSFQGQNAFYSPCHFVSILLVGHSVGSLQTDGQKVESRAGFCLGRIRNKFDKNLPAMFFNN